jgi:hypothetical protein
LGRRKLAWRALPPGGVKPGSHPAAPADAIGQSMTPSHDPLDDLLDRCRAAPDPSAQIALKVSRRIAGGSSPARAGWTRRLDAAFARPSFASAFVAACVLLGLFLAEVRLSRIHAAQSAQMAQGYLQLIDPLIETPAAPHSASSS